MNAADTRPTATPIWVRLPTFQPRATNLLLGLLAVIYVYEIVAAGGAIDPAESGDVLLTLGAKDNTLILAGEYWRLVSAMFLHASILHIAFNGYALLAFGQQIERFYGIARFLAIYFIAGLAGSIASFAFSPAESVGASGAISGIIGAMCVFFWMQRRLLGAVARVQLWPALVIVGLNAGLGVVQVGAVDYWAHGGGFLAGMVAAWLLAPRYHAGRFVAADERMLEDQISPWMATAIVLTLLAVELGLFAGALLAQS
ncbi:MAG TPA: rhomboid family intramembrane serine protease [Chloroflexia bacterium]|nr:rhomboid family intramembrane serine protease [Chloroflexia bacterium]